MARRRRSAATDPFADLAKKIEILEREMATQRAAMARLREKPERPEGRTATHPTRKTA